MEGMTVIWRRPDIHVDPNRYVHLYPEHQHQEDLTMPSYVGRTEMFADGLKLGNLSLRIRSLKPSDDGRYRCIIPHLALDTTIKLEVFALPHTVTTKQFQGNLQTPDPKQETEVKVVRHDWSSWFVVLAFCALLVVAVGRFLKPKCQRPHLPCCFSETKSPPSSPAQNVGMRASDVGYRPAARQDSSGPTGETS